MSIVLATMNRYDGPPFKMGSYVNTNDTTHTQEGIKRFITYIMQLSGKSRVKYK